MELADRILPHLIGGSVPEVSMDENAILLVGWHDGEFQLISRVYDKSSESVFEEVVVSADNWDAFIRRVASEMQDVSVPTVEMLDLESLEQTIFNPESQRELIDRAKAAAKQLNEINRILYRSGIRTLINVHESHMMSGVGGLHSIDIKYMKEV